MTPDQAKKLPDDYRFPGHQYTMGEMRKMIADMREANKAFYPLACSTGCHTFIEFCGMQSKFIDLCEEAMLNGVEFPFANKHNQQALPMHEHHAEYLGEKFGCIYGFALKDYRTRRAFEDAAFND